MCFNQPQQAPPPPPVTPPSAPLAPITPSLPPPPKPLQDVDEINPKVRATQSKKAKNPQAQGTGALRIPLGTNLNIGGASTGQGGGLNK